MLISLSVWLLAYTIFYELPHFTALILPLIVIPFCLVVLGFSWLLASLGVFLQDLKQVVGLIVTAMLFLSPVFYSTAVFPNDYVYLLYFNPITFAIETSRDLLIWNKTPNAFSLLIYWCLACLVSWVGFFIFQKILHH